MDFYFINEGPIWVSILVIIFGIILLGLGLSFLKLGEARGGPWWAIGLYFKKNKNPYLYWFTICFYLFLGLSMIVLGLIMII